MSLTYKQAVLLRSLTEKQLAQIALGLLTHHQSDFFTAVEDVLQAEKSNKRTWMNAYDQGLYDYFKNHINDHFDENNGFLKIYKGNESLIIFDHRIQVIECLNSVHNDMTVRDQNGTTAKVNLIKHVRNRYSLSLYDAKAIVELLGDTGFLPPACKGNPGAHPEFTVWIEPK